MKRAQLETISQDLAKKMVILVGPRQSGKTHLSKQIAERYKRPVYLNYDRAADQKIIQDESWLKETDFLVLDEIHKYPDWKNKVKGIYDTKPTGMHLLITGSARLETFRHSGDSLAGRYYLHHLLPFTPMELYQLSETIDLDRLIAHSGFPEPYLAQTEVEVRRWRQAYVDSLLTIDALTLDSIQNYRALHTLFKLLCERVGSPISYNSLAQDIGISPVTVKRYITLLESLFVIFIVTPYSNNIGRSLLKEPKIYFFDTGLIQNDKGAAFENLVALGLYKQMHAERDTLGLETRLHYIRTKDQKEVDFAFCHDEKITLLVEAKYSDSELCKNLYYFSNKYTLPSIQVVKDLKRERQASGIPIVRADYFLTHLDKFQK
jgi:uncharacterized protein